MNNTPNSTPEPEALREGRKSGHTPGPWFYDAVDQSIVPTNEDHLSICQIDRMDKDGGPKGFKFGEESLANARLIAAAPALYEALQFFVDHPGVWQLCSPNSEAMTRARAALTQAGGSQ